MSIRKRRIKLLGIQAGAGGREPGAEDGPYVLREKGLIDCLLSAGHSVEDLGDIPGVYETRFVDSSGANELPKVLQVNRHTHACVLGSRHEDPHAFMLIIGGDHSLAIGTLAGLSDSCDRLGVIWIDAHADFNTPASSPSGNIHGMSLAVACGDGLLDLRLIADRDPMINAGDIAIFAARDIDPGELEALEEHAVSWMGVDELRREGVTSTVLAAARRLAEECDHVHLSFDVDALDPSVMPATGTPVPAGLTSAEAIDMLTALGESDLIDSAEFVEFNPELDRSGAASELIMKLVSALVGDARRGSAK